MEDIARFYTLDGQYIGAFAGGAVPPAGAVEVAAPIDVLPTEDQLSILALNKRDELLGTAALRVAPLQDAVDRKRATDDEALRLNLWKDYRIDLNRIEQQDGFPTDIDWPQSPDEVSQPGGDQ